jgi:dTDP-4-dehydrorhamnose reductase
MPRARRVLLTGATGYLGRFVHRVLLHRGDEVITLGRTHADVSADVADLDGLSAQLGGLDADLALHAGAVSQMGVCAAEPAVADRVNGDASGRIAARFPTLYVSTDLVFDGASAPYRADAVPQPLSAYGRSKTRGEDFVRAAAGLVVRVPLLFGPSHDGRRGASDMLRHALNEGRGLGLFVDEFRTPLHVADAAAGLVRLLESLPERAGSVVHLGGPERVSRYDFAERFGAVHGLDMDRVEAVASSDPTRPKDVSLVSDVDARRSLDAMLRDS